ncbi:hypothetical protein BC830DRAFT_667051 [Chytriomyces sp. MP71]|nr:hypothetical protein BC830DRAFT_667051 [Chytriomyces sp. MP71]
MAKWKPPGDRLLNQCKRTIQNQINFKRRLEDLVSSNEALRKARIEAAVALKKQTQQTADAEIKLSQIEAKLLEKDMALLAAIERADVAERKQVVANVSTQTTLLRIPEKSKSGNSPNTFCLLFPMMNTLTMTLEHPTLASKIEIPLKTVKGKLSINNERVSCSQSTCFQLVLSVAEEFGARRPTKRSLAAIRIELQIPDIDPQPSKGIDSRMKKKARLEADATLPDHPHGSKLSPKNSLPQGREHP